MYISFRAEVNSNEINCKCFMSGLSRRSNTLKVKVKVFGSSPGAIAIYHLLPYIHT